MTTDEKLMALKALTPTCLEMCKPCDWYVSAHARETKKSKEDEMLTRRYGNGATPQAAIDDDWEQISTAPIVVLNAGTDRREVRWSGYMWEDVK